MPLPPWLDVKPSDYAQAAQAGIAFGQKRDAMVDQAREAAQATAAHIAGIAAQHDVALQKLQQEKESAQQEMQAKKQIQEQDFRTQQARDNVNGAYRMATLQLGQQRLEQAAKEKMMSVADIQGYWNAVNSGVSHAEAASKFPRAMSAGMGTAMTRSETAPTRMSDIDRIRLQSAHADFTKGSTALNQSFPGMDTTPIKEQISNAKRTIDEIEGKYGKPSTATGNQNPLEGKRVRNKKTGEMGKIVNGSFVPDSAAKDVPTEEPAPEEPSAEEPETDETPA